MIRILYMSDLHLEMEPGLGLAGRGTMLDEAILSGIGPVDLVALAGDVHSGLRGVAYAEQLGRSLAAPVAMIAGNHEFYHHDIATLLPALEQASAKTAGRVQFLENAKASYQIAGQRVNLFGCTLWTDYALHGQPAAAMAAAFARMNDHRLIRNGGALFMPADALAMHRRSRLWLANALAAEPEAINIVVTHHAPSGTMLGNRTGKIAPAYGSELLAEFAARRPALWIHGHTHYRHESLAQGIRVVSAPRGYPGDSEAPFRPGLAEL